MMKTMWSLVQDDEYVISRLSQELSLFPTIYGSCGSLYIVEEIEPLSYDSASWGKEISFKKFGERAIVAMAIMDFLEELDTVFEEPIHLCDIKASHFGISYQGRVKFLDLDAIFAKSILGMYEKIALEMCNKRLDYSLFFEKERKFVLYD